MVLLLHPFSYLTSLLFSSDRAAALLKAILHYQGKFLLYGIGDANAQRFSVFVSIGNVLRELGANEVPTARLSALQDELQTLLCRYQSAFGLGEFLSMTRCLLLIFFSHSPIGSLKLIRRPVLNSQCSIMLPFVSPFASQ